MTFEGALKKIQAKFAEVDGTKLADMAVQVTLTDEDCGGTLYFKAADGVIDVQGYDYRDNDATIDISRKALMDVLAGKSNLDKEVEKGAATVKGNFEKLDTLKAAIAKYEAPKKAAPAKKTVADKKAAEAPKTEATAAPAKKTCCKRTCAKKTEATAAPAKKAAAAKKSK